MGKITVARFIEVPRLIFWFGKLSLCVASRGNVNLSGRRKEGFLWPSKAHKLSLEESFGRAFFYVLHDKDNFFWSTHVVGFFLRTMGWLADSTVRVIDPIILNSTLWDSIFFYLVIVKIWLESLKKKQISLMDLNLEILTVFFFF